MSFRVCLLVTDGDRCLAGINLGVIEDCFADRQCRNFPTDGVFDAGDFGRDRGIDVGAVFEGQVGIYQCTIFHR